MRRGRANLNASWLTGIYRFSKESNVNIVNFCKLKDSAIEQKFNVTEEAKEMYKQFLGENLSHERKLREKK